MRQYLLMMYDSVCLDSVNLTCFPRVRFCIFASSQRTNSEGEVCASLWDDVALLPKQTQEQVLGVTGPAVDPGVLQPAGHMSLTETEAVEQVRGLSLPQSNFNSVVQTINFYY
ncbi:hypothetical protein ILYODFUR_028506 [Ilyodon furcidens]|uniref:Uncharacterized protein n=1 Tax=Ilyodon furcidens TaxID=33524 RepID=A0ABV0TZJ2_9TELE